MQVCVCACIYHRFIVYINIDIANGTYILHTNTAHDRERVLNWKIAQRKLIYRIVSAHGTRWCWDFAFRCFSAFSTIFSLSWFWETLDAEQFSSNISRAPREWDGNMTVCVRASERIPCVYPSVVFQLIHTHTNTHLFEKVFHFTSFPLSILSCFLYAVTGRRMFVWRKNSSLRLCSSRISKRRERARDREKEREGMHYHD